MISITEKGKKLSNQRLQIFDYSLSFLTDVTGFRYITLLNYYMLLLFVRVYSQFLSNVLYKIMYQQLAPF